VSLFAIDEAPLHQRMGTRLRPEYRQISTLREKFPEVPVMALRHRYRARACDIVKHCTCASRACYVASFNPSNLTYRVSAKTGAYDQILSFIRARPREGGIIYCQARKTTEDLAQSFRRRGEGVCRITRV